MNRDDIEQVLQREARRQHAEQGDRPTRARARGTESTSLDQDEPRDFEERMGEAAEPGTSPRDLRNL